MSKQWTIDECKAERDELLEAAQIAVLESTPLNPEDLSDGIVITESSYAALFAAIANTKEPE